MSYFTIKSNFWLVSSNSCDEEFAKIDNFIFIIILLYRKSEEKRLW